LKNLLFYLGFATLITHELDAMTQSEWRLLFVLRSLPEQVASSAFVILHIPLIAVLLWLTSSESLNVRYWSRITVAAFLIVHFGLHKALEHHPAYSFDSLLSLCLIYGGGLVGLIYLGLIFISWRQSCS
jgi:hypothetical protein